MGFFESKTIFLFGVLLYIYAAQARLSVMYAHERLTDYVADQCLNEMFPKAKLTDIQETDEPCIIFCVLKKFGIMTAGGGINLDVYRRRVLSASDNPEQRAFQDYGSSCVETAEATQHKQDVCRKAKVFNDCTHLYRILLKK